MREVTGVPGVRGALIVSIDDGLVVAESAMADVETTDVAALAAAVLTRATRCAVALGGASPSIVHLAAEEGSLLAVAGESPLWMVAVAGSGAEIGRLRLLLSDFAPALA